MTLAKRNYDPNARGTLEGVRVLDLSRLVAGNQLTQVLGDYGAEVIKIEPPAGDTLRAWQTKGVPINWKVYARNKKSLGLELRAKEARDIGTAVKIEAEKVDAFRDAFLAHAAAALCSGSSSSKSHFFAGILKNIILVPVYEDRKRLKVGYS
mgnify:CR=1 FL=1